MSAADVRAALGAMVAADAGLLAADAALADAVATASAAKMAQEKARAAWATAAQRLALALGPIGTPEQRQAAELAVTVPVTPRLAEPDETAAARLRATVLRVLGNESGPVALATLAQVAQMPAGRISRALDDLKHAGKVVRIGRGFWQLATWAPPARDLGAGRDYRKSEDGDD